MNLDASIGLLFIFLLFLFIFLLAFVLRYRKRAKETENLKAQFSHTLLQSQLEIQEQTLQHISNELHDNIAQVANVIKMNLYTIKLVDINKAESRLEDLKELIKQLITDIRSLSVNLNGDRIAKIGLTKALETEIERIAKTGLFVARFEADGDFINLNESTSIILYRMVQEVLNNMIKHSNASEIHLRLTSNENYTEITITDNGIGFNVNDTIKKGTGAGLNNLQKRADLINAVLIITSIIGEGTKIFIQIP